MDNCDTNRWNNCDTNQCCTKCYYCKKATNILNYYHRFGHIICSDCINYIRACNKCNKWYTKGIIKLNNKLMCIDCLNKSL